MYSPPFSNSTLLTTALTSSSLRPQATVSMPACTALSRILAERRIMAISSSDLTRRASSTIAVASTKPALGIDVRNVSYSSTVKNQPAFSTPMRLSSRPMSRRVRTVTSGACSQSSTGTWRVSHEYSGMLSSSKRRSTRTGSSPGATMRQWYL